MLGCGAASGEGGRVRAPRGGDAPDLGPTVRRAQGLRICHGHLPARRLAERVVSPAPKVVGRDTLRPSFAPDNCVHAKFAEFTFHALV
jgi:hypothetical protein